MKNKKDEQRNSGGIAEVKLISPKKLSLRWSISLSSVYGLKCGTDRLTRVRCGRSLRFLLSEIELIESKMKNNHGGNL